MATIMNRGEKDIKTLLEILKHNRQDDLAELLVGSQGEVWSGNQYGSYWNSVISMFIVYSPLKQYYRLKKITDSDKKLLLDSILEIYPHAEAEPEITNVEFRILQEESISESLQEKEIGKEIRIFISYSVLDKIVAGEIKKAFSGVGFASFLAHEDIRPSAEWVDVILDNLSSSDIFVPLITKHFRESDWTAQESGYALSKDMLIIPVSVNNYFPYGFISKFQALKLDPDHAHRESKKIIDTILEKGKECHFKYRLTNTIIKTFEESNSFENAGGNVSRLLIFDDFDDDQINRIFKAVIDNGQIQASWSARSHLISLLKKYKGKINKEILGHLESKTPELFATEGS